VLSHALWQSQFGADDRTVGATILLDNEPYTVVGVMPADSAFDRGGRAQAALMSTFSTVAVVLAAIGMYGVLAYSVALRRREIGIRAALGASSSRLIREVLGRGLGVTLAGLSIGVAGAMALAPLLGSVLYNVQTRDPFLMALATTVLVLAGLIASAVPARRAANVDPIVVLRGD
jgi:ABC-type antimicrobial peptide transport system permease subunit